MKEFKINEFLKLKLENDKTLIYVEDTKVLQCKYLLLNPIDVNSEENSPVKSDLSLDDQVDNLDPALETSEKPEELISPKTEFWAHSSNLQVWYENAYDTRILHSNLAFPLLKKLTKAGDTLAKKVFKTEIMKRFRSGNMNVMTFLVKEGYLDFLGIEESETLYEELSFEEYKELQKRLRDEKKNKEGFLLSSS